jgi:hypothetical protein
VVRQAIDSGSRNYEAENPFYETPYCHLHEFPPQLALFLLNLESL